LEKEILLCLLFCEERRLASVAMTPGVFIVQYNVSQKESIKSLLRDIIEGEAAYRLPLNDNNNLVKGGLYPIARDKQVTPCRPT
jgi:hypothetical protein